MLYCVSYTIFFYFLHVYLILYIYNYMWGNILTELSYMQNFNMSFSNNKADVLIHLTQ